MTFDDYICAVKHDLREFIEDNHMYYSTFRELYDEAFIDDSVTGNGSGSYTFNTEEARGLTDDLQYDDGALRAFADMGYDHIPYEDGYESVDVIARCAALGELYEWGKSKFYDCRAEGF